MLRDVRMAALARCGMCRAALRSGRLPPSTPMSSGKCCVMTEWLLWPNAACAVLHCSQTAFRPFQRFTPCGLELQWGVRFITKYIPGERRCYDRKFIQTDPVFSAAFFGSFPALSAGLAQSVSTHQWRRSCLEADVD